MSKKSKRLVVVTHRRLDDLRSGSGAYLMMALREAKRAGFELHLLMAPSTAFSSRPWCILAPELTSMVSPHWRGALKFGRLYLSLSAVAWGRFFRRLLIEVCRRLKINLGALDKVRGRLAYTLPERERRAVVRALNGLNPDAAMVEYSSLGPVLADTLQIPIRAVLMHDSFSRRSQTFAAHAGVLEFEPMPAAEEAERLAGANLILHASRDELDFLGPLLPQAQHIWVRPIAQIKPKALRRQDPACVFMGANHTGNREGLSHLLEQIWPSVRANNPQARLLVVGAVGESVSVKPDGVEILGPVADLSAFVGPDLIGLAPIRLASGVAIKVAEYLGAGMPVVGYPGGLDGFGDALDGVAVRVESAPAFAEAIGLLLKDGERRLTLSEAGRVIAETKLNSSGLSAALMQAPKPNRNPPPASGYPKLGLAG